MLKRFSIVVLVAGLVGCAGQRPHEGIPLVWKPTSSLNVGVIPLNDFSKVTLTVRPFADTRTDKQSIGKNIEHLPAIQPVTTRDNVAAFCTEHFKEILKRQGLKVSNNGNVVLSGEVVEFFVTEENTYDARVAIKLMATDASGKVLWEGMIGGDSHRFGRSYSLENYYETLSDALIDGVQHLLQGSNFSSSIRGAGKS
jgi:uncharacterized lipoprotein YajG